MIHGGGGSDTFIADDSIAAMYVYGDVGNDNFLIGRVLKTKTVEVGGEKIEVVDGLDGITPGGDLITLYPASFVGPFDSALFGDTGKTSMYLPLPDVEGGFSFTGGYVHLTDEFYPEHPRFEIGPVVPCVGCTKDNVPPHYTVAGDVTFGPDVLKTTLGGREEYFIMRQ